MPQDMDMGWWAQGVKRLENYVKVTYFKGKFNVITKDEDSIESSGLDES
jgi:hypothetical protein